jgi:uncharacterized membrane protein
MSYYSQIEAIIVVMIVPAIAIGMLIWFYKSYKKEQFRRNYRGKKKD